MSYLGNVSCPERLLSTVKTNIYPTRAKHVLPHQSELSSAKHSPLFLERADRGLGHEREREREMSLRVCVFMIMCVCV